MRSYKVLVTGGAGFIGSHLVDKLIEEGYSVKVIDNLSSGSLENLSMHKDDPKLELIIGDLKRPEIFLKR
jgi:UDP-glucose 4-epimerase